MTLTKRNKILLFLCSLVCAYFLGAHVRELDMLKVLEAKLKNSVDKVALEGCELIAIDVNNQLYNCEHAMQFYREKNSQCERFVFENCSKK